MYLLIDNYDSFTYNLYQAFISEGIDLLVKRNNEITLEEIESLNPEKIIISPGPKTPNDSGISVDLINTFASKIPILGICLGHQCIVTGFGGSLRRVSKVLHGKTSKIYHLNNKIFEGISSPFIAARYHSLETIDIPASLKVIAKTDDDIVMAVQHKEFPVIGLQFHPESFLTKNGKQIIRNFIKTKSDEKLFTSNR